MVRRRVPRCGTFNALLLGLAGIICGLLLVAGLWWCLPPRPIVSAGKPGDIWLKLMSSADGKTLLGVQQHQFYLLETDTLRVHAACPLQYFHRGKEVEQFWLSADGSR